MLEQVDKAKLHEIADRYQLDLIVLFGSYAKGKTHPEDLDIAVRTTRQAFERLSADHKARWQWEMNLLADLDEIVDQPYDIDLVLLNQMDNSTLLFEIARYGKLIYQKEPTTFLCFRSYAARRFDDDAKFRQLGWEYLKRWCHDNESAV
ncbi:MAG: nucleotidyltransferase domain-containing protein [Candidatus Poribacteria bacterium]|nr:nucleotidyltransferase domain-containing protein [Candidatus Poribacteria bacterium]